MTVGTDMDSLHGAYVNFLLNNKRVLYVIKLRSDNHWRFLFIYLITYKIPFSLFLVEKLRGYD
jgi:hypothetical protein